MGIKASGAGFVSGKLDMSDIREVQAHQSADARAPHTLDPGWVRTVLS